MLGSQIDKYSDEELLKMLPKVKIFARTSPVHKFRIVKLFQESGETVAVTGDGVNDAIALKQADVGVAMGLVGTDVARETADMVISDDNFVSIVNAVEEGRGTIRNLRNSITYLLSCNISEAISLILALFLGFPGIFYPIQFLYINLITDGYPALSLAFSPKAKRLMEEKPAKELILIDNFDRKYIFLVGILSSLLVLVAFYIYTLMDNEQVGRTAAFTVLTLTQSFVFVDLWLSHRPIFKHKQQLYSPLFISAFLLPFIFQLFIVLSPTAANFFKIAPVSIFTYLEFVLFSGLILVGIKGVKIYLLRRQ
jgi:P-type Ca2+ transporter type 2C